jgi:thiol:disulfide interchange protein DsbG
MNRLAFAWCLAVGLALAGCKDSTPPAAAPRAQAAPVSVEAIASEATGITVGSSMSVRTVYVFFDPQCPHCAALWQAAKPLKSQAKFVWIPVRLLGDASLDQGAALLKAADPAQAMDEHESAVAAGRKDAPAAPADADAQKNAVRKNTELMTRLRFESVPTIVAKHAQTQQVVTREGSLPTAELAALLGLQVPAGS